MLWIFAVSQSLSWMINTWSNWNVRIFRLDSIQSSRCNQFNIFFIRFFFEMPHAKFKSLIFNSSVLLNIKSIKWLKTKANGGIFFFSDIYAKTSATVTQKSSICSGEFKTKMISFLLQYMATVFGIQFPSFEYCNFCVNFVFLFFFFCNNEP